MRVGNSFTYKAYMLSSRIGHNGPIQYSVRNVDHSTTDKATVHSATGKLDALKSGQIRICFTYSGAPWIWSWVVTLEFYGCKPYHNIASSNDVDYAGMNCHGYAFFTTSGIKANWLQLTYADLQGVTNSNQFLAIVKQRFETHWIGVFFDASKCEDVTNQGGINASLAANQWLVVMRVGWRSMSDWDYHYWYRTNTGEWVNKHGWKSCSQQLGTDVPTDNNSDGWVCDSKRQYYDSDLVYYRLTE